MSLLNIIKKNKTSILLAEFGALLHDLDKMSYDYFLEHISEHDLKEEYREKKYGEKKVSEIKKERWEKIIKINSKEVSFPDINEIFIGMNERGKKSKTNIAQKDENIISSSFVFHHEMAAKVYPLGCAIVHPGICGADGIDSDLDKTGGKDQKVNSDNPYYRIDTPFGHFMKIVFKKDNESKKFEQINELIIEYRERINNLSHDQNELPLYKIKNILSDSLGGTKYPFNDVTLWAHSYSVASMAKATLIKILIESDFLSNKCGNEKQYMLPARTRWENGNAADFTFLRICIDRDVLLLRAQKAGDIVGFDEQIVELKNEIRRYIEKELLIGNEVYRDEDMQLFVIPKLGTWEAKKKDFGDIHAKFESEVRTEIDNKIQELLENKNCHEFAYEIAFSDDDSGDEQNVAERILKRSKNLLSKRSKQISCRQNPRLLIKINSNNENQGRCPVCNVRYATKKNDDKLCGICVKRRSGYNRKRINIPANTVNLEECLAQEDNKLVLITAQFDLRSIRDGSIFESVRWQSGNNTVKKNPSPGRLYRCWETLESFFREFVEDVVPNDTEIKELFGIIENDNEGIKTFRITISPKTLQFITTAQAAPIVINKMYELYEKQFGKFRNNLPLSIGAIFFYKKFPLYAVFDAAKNMKILLKPSVSEENWKVTDRRNDNGENTLFLEPHKKNGFGSGDNVFIWKIPILLSDNKRADMFHPNFKVSTDNNNERYKHVSEITANDSVYVRDGKFEFTLLGSAVQRHSIMHDRIRHHIFGKKTPYDLSVISLFPRLEKLIDRLSDTQIKQMESLLIEKMLSWKIEWKKVVNENDSPEKKTVENFCKSVLFSKNAFGKKAIYDKLKNGDKELLIRSAVSGLLIDFLDIKLHCATGR